MSDPGKKIVLTDGLFAFINSQIKENASGVYVAVGSGNSAWNNFDPPDPSPSTSRLIKEEARKKAVAIEYLNPGTKDVSDVPAKKLLIKSPFFSLEDFSMEPGQESISICECGVFINADDTPGSGTLIACSRFRTITITKPIKIAENFYIDFQ